jgi:hypothetical protein
MFRQLLAIIMRHGEHYKEIHIWGTQVVTRRISTKVKLFLCLVKQYGGVVLPLLTLVLDGDQWSASRPGRFFPRGDSPLYPLHRRLGWSQN